MFSEPCEEDYDVTVAELVDPSMPQEPDDEEGDGFEEEVED
jgi:hypothetical protein